MRVEKLTRLHQVDRFDCGEAGLNSFLIRHALQSQQANGSQTYVALDGEAVIGFHTLAVGGVEHEGAPERLRKGLPRHPVPIMILARLAVAQNRQGQGLGGWLLKDAIVRTLAAAEIAGIRALMVHAKDDAARAYYARFGFIDGFPDPLHMYVLTKELKSLAAG